MFSFVEKIDEGFLITLDVNKSNALQELFLKIPNLQLTPQEDKNLTHFITYEELQPHPEFLEELTKLAGDYEAYVIKSLLDHADSVAKFWQSFDLDTDNSICTYNPDRLSAAYNTLPSIHQQLIDTGIPSDHDIFNEIILGVEAAIAVLEKYISNDTILQGEEHPLSDTLKLAREDLIEFRGIALVSNNLGMIAANQTSGIALDS